MATGLVAFGYVDPLARMDDFGQPAGEPNPLIEPSWMQICAMGYEIPGIGVIGGDVVAGILEVRHPHRPGAVG